MKVKDILNTKGSSVAVIGPDRTLMEALRTMVDTGVGALPVTGKDGLLAGIVSERDLL